MRYALFLAYWLQTIVALVIAPVMRFTGLRFGKSCRGNWFVNHVHANMLADGFHPNFCRFFNKYF